MEKVVFTRKLNFIEYAWSYINGIIPVVKPMIKIKPNHLSPDQKKAILSSNYGYIVFTSKNAVKYYKRLLRYYKKSKVFNDIEFIVIGQRTAKQLSRFKNTIHVFDFKQSANFPEFVNNITQKRPYIYLCSDLAAVKWQWYANHQNATIIELYSTLANTKKINTKKVNRLVFMSSSAVNSFFQKNFLQTENTTCYALGEPTKLALANYYRGLVLKPKALSFFSIISLIKNTNK